MTDKVEVAKFAALAEGLGADEIGIRQVAVIDDVAVAKHGTESVNHSIFRENVLV